MRSELRAPLLFAGAVLALGLSACDRDGGDVEEAPAPEPEQVAEETGPARIDIGDGFISQVSDGEVSPSRSATELGAICTGRVGAEPSHIIEVQAAGRYRILAESGEDLTMAVVGPGGPFCNDDWQALNPAVEREWEPGTWDVYIGAVDVELARARFELMVQKVEAAELTGPRWDTAPVDGTHRLSAGFSPRTFDVTAGGTERAEAYRLAPACVGYISPAAPTVTLESPGIAEPVTIALASEVDTTLVVRGPDGVWHCSDDAEGDSPQLRLESFIGGSWTIWAGTWSAEPSAASLEIERIRPAGE